MALTMRERTDPKFFQFCKPGDVLAGGLVGIEVAEVGGKKTARYTVQDLDSKELFAFLGTVQINSKIRRSDIGHGIEVRFEGTNPDVVKNGNPMRVFKVRVSDEVVTSDSIIITDSDVGF